MVAEAVVNQLTRAKPCGKNGPRHAPIVTARAFGFVNRARAGKQARHLRPIAQGAEAAKHIAPGHGTAGLLALQQLVLARYRQLRQGLTAGHGGRVYGGQNLRQRGRGLLGMGHLGWQGGHQSGFALGQFAGFERVKKSRHGGLPQASQRLRRL